MGPDVAAVSLDPMQVGVNQAGIAIAVGLHQLVSGIPLACFSEG
jgi:hypothetical protein